MDEQEFMERMKRANSKVKDGMVAQVIDMLPEDRELASIKSKHTPRFQPIYEPLPNNLATVT